MPYKKYSTDDLNQALEAVQNGNLTAYKASKLYKLPYQTLLDKIKNKHPNPSGQPTVLKKEEEEILVKWVHHMAEIGFPVTKEQFLHSVGRLVTELNRPNTFKDGIPGREWYRSFLKRNPSMSIRAGQSLTTARIGATKEKIHQWFTHVYQYMENNNYLDILQDPSRIFNCDESAFFLCPKGQAVLAKKGQKTVYTRSGNDEKENLTLCLGASADGKLMPIMAIFPYKRIPNNILQKYPKEWVVGKSDSGWMTCQTFFEYIANQFNGFLIKENIKKPVILFLDGHVSHLSLPLTTFCKENGIILVALLPNATHVLQPMDVAVFHALKSSWKKSISDWRMANNGQKLKREDFAPILDQCIQKTLKPEILINGFRSTGLHPFDKNAINYDKLLKSSDERSTSESCSGTPLIDLESSEKLEESTSCQPFSEEIIAAIEKILGPEKLKIFENCDGVWQGDIEDTNLFYFWRKVKGNTNNEVEIGESTLEANDCTLQNIGDIANMSWENNNLLEGVIEGDRTLTLTPHLTMCSPIQETECTKNSRLPPKGSDPIASDDDNINFNPDINNTSTPSTKSKNEQEILDATLNRDSPKKDSNNQKKSNYPTPFKNSLLWPETNIAEKAKKNVRKTLIPTVATSTEYMEYQKRIENMKKEKTEKMELRKKEREEKATAKMAAKMKLNEHKNESSVTLSDSVSNKKDKTKLKTNKTRNTPEAHSKNILGQVTYNSPVTVLQSETNKKDKTKSKTKKTSNSVEDSENVLEEITYNVGEYVVVNYEGEHFPGTIIKTAIQGTSRTYEVKSMTISGLDTITGRVNWRWPDKEDVLMYNYKDIIKKINTPVPLNKRGVFSVTDL